MKRVEPKRLDESGSPPRLRVVVLTLFHFPAEHWRHLRTTSPIERMFATVRLRHRKTKGNGSRVARLAMVFKLSESASRSWRLLNGAKRLPELLAGWSSSTEKKPRNAPPNYAVINEI